MELLLNMQELFKIFSRKFQSFFLSIINKQLTNCTFLPIQQAQELGSLIFIGKAPGILECRSH